MHRPLSCLVSVVLAAGATLPAQERTYAQLLSDMVDMDWLWRAPQPGERCIQFSSYNRESEKGPDDHGAWYANWDQGHYLRVEEREGRKEYVMVDAAGPACVVRMWSANPKGRLLFYVDGAKTPTWDVDFTALLTGEVSPFLPPLAAKRAKGCNLYAPIPFAKHLKITTTQKDCFYHVNVRYFAKGVQVPSFTPELAKRHREDVARVREALTKIEVGRRGQRVHGSFRVDDGAGTQLELGLRGPGVIRGLRVRLEPRKTTESRLVSRAAVLRIREGGHVLVQAPVEDFFGAGPGFDAYAGYAMGVTGDGWGYCRFPMPIAGAGKITVDVDSVADVRGGEIECFFEQRDLPVDHLVFHAAYRQAKDIPTRPFSEYRIVSARGPGRFVGCALAVFNPSKIWWGEGDEKIWVDDDSFPSTFGTGTEDYFGYAWCCPDVFQSPFFNQVRCDGPRNAGHTSLNRVHIADQIPFQKSLRFDLEVWHWREGIALDYASCAWWYAAPGKTAQLPAIPGVDARRPRPWAPPKVLRVPGALEGETLEVVAKTGGKREVQDTAQYDGQWSGDQHVWWHGAQKGDRLTLRLPVPKPGRYELRARFTKANDYGIVQVEVDGEPVGGEQDLYAPHVSVTEEIPLGNVELAGESAQLVLHIVGINPKAAKKYMAGLDYVRLVAVR